MIIRERTALGVGWLRYWREKFRPFCFFKGWMPSWGGWHKKWSIRRFEGGRAVNWISEGWLEAAMVETWLHQQLSHIAWTSFHDGETEDPFWLSWPEKYGSRIAIRPRASKWTMRANIFLPPRYSKTYLATWARYWNYWYNYSGFCLRKYPFLLSVVYRWCRGANVKDVGLRKWRLFCLHLTKYAFKISCSLLLIYNVFI